MHVSVNYCMSFRDDYVIPVTISRDWTHLGGHLSLPFLIHPRKGNGPNTRKKEKSYTLNCIFLTIYMNYVQLSESCKLSLIINVIFLWHNFCFH